MVSTSSTVDNQRFPSNGETIVGRQLRLLAGRGVREVAVIAGADADRLRAEVDRPEFGGLQVRYLPAASLDEVAAWLGEVAAGEGLLLLADDLVFTPDLVDLLLDDPAPRLALAGDETDGGLRLTSQPAVAAGPAGQDGVTGLKVLARDGIVRMVDPGLTAGASRMFWPVLKLDRAAIEIWWTQVAELADEADAALIGLNRVAGELAIGLRPVSGRFVARVDETAAGDALSERVRRADLRTQPVISEPRGYVRLGAELAEREIARVLLIADRSYEQREIARYLEELDLEVVRFSEFSAVPTWQEILTALRVFQANRCQAVLSVGDAAAISVGKLVTLHSSAAPSPELIDQTPAVTPASPLTFPAAGSYGTRSPADALIEVDGEVRRLRHDRLLPDLVFLDSTLWAEDAERQRHAAALAALSQSVSSVWAAAATDESRRYALEALNLLLDLLFGFVKGDDPRAQQAMMTAANLAGRATTLTGGSLTGALGHGLAAGLTVDPGEAAAFALPAVWRALVERLPSCPDDALVTEFRGACELLSDCLGAKDVQQAIVRTERIIELLRPRDVVGRVPDASRSAFPPAIDPELCPLPLTDDRIRAVDAEARAFAAAQPPQRDDVDVLTRFGAFCRERRLSCHLFGQTLRDAVTIGRLSPWSGPITVAMPRAGYDKLVRWRDQLPPELWLDDASVSPGSGRAWSRIVWSAGTRPPDPDALPGIVIRILESVNDGSAPSQLVRHSALSLLHRATWVAEQGEARSPGARGTAGRLAGRLGAERLGRLRLRLTADARRRPGTHTYVDPGLTREFAGSQYPAAWFGKRGEQMLDGQTFRAPVRPEAVLGRLFGAGFGDARAIPTGAVPPVPLARAQAPAESLATAPEPFVSVIVPVYDVERYLPECLDSLCLQDTDGYEVIAVDDGSPDGSHRILQDYQRRFPEILRVVRKPNGGLSDARNYGMQFARGEYLGFVDSDDFVMPELIRLMKRKAAATNADIVVCSHAEYWAESNRAEVRWMNFVNSYGHSVGERPELLVAAHPYAWNKIYRRRLFDDYGISYPKGQAFEDSATTFNLMLHANRIEYVDKALYCYRMDRADSITNTFDEKFYDIFKSFDSIREFYTRHGRYDEFRDEISELMRRTSFARVGALESCEDPARVDAFLTAVYDYLDRYAPGWAENRYFRRQLSNPKYGDDPKYRAMGSRRLMRQYFERLWRERATARTDQP